ncbi:MAG: aldose epimerase family protein [Chitinophagaceae bacterium]
MKIEREKFQQKLDHADVDLYYLINNYGMQVAITNYGARIVSIITTDKFGKDIDTVLGFNSLEGYLKAHEAYFGATIGRYANRIRHGKFTLDNNTYSLAINNGQNHLHGGKNGFHAKVWHVEYHNHQELKLSYLSKDQEENYPGNLTTIVHFSLTEKNELVIEYKLNADKTTIANITNHTFFNLNGEGNEEVLNHILEIKANEFLAIDKTSIPIGNPIKLENTPFDFRMPKLIGQDINSKNIQIKNGAGYDHCFILENNKTVKEAASCYSPLTGIYLQVLTDLPGIQLYTGNWLGNIDKGKSGKYYGTRSAFCLETQFFPNTPNEPTYPTCIVNPNEIFKTTTIYKYGIKY